MPARNGSNLSADGTGFAGMTLAESGTYLVSWPCFSPRLGPRSIYTTVVYLYSVHYYVPRSSVPMYTTPRRMKANVVIASMSRAGFLPFCHASVSSVQR